MEDDPADKLIIVSVVDSPPPLGVTGLIQAWSVSSLVANLSRQRREMEEEFLPVAAFTADRDLFVKTFGLLRLPQTVWLGWAAKNFGRARIDVSAQRAIFSHYATITDSGQFLLAAWATAVGFPGLTSGPATLSDEGDYGHPHS